MIGPAHPTWRARSAPTTAVALGLAVIGLSAAGVVLDSVTHQSGTGGPALDALVSIGIGTLPATTVGALLAARRPRNPIGWMLLAILLLEFLPNTQYIVLDYRMHHGTLPLGWVAVVTQEFWPILLLLISLLLWVFPDGKLPGGRWRVPAIVAVSGWALICCAMSSQGVLAVASGDVRVQADGDLAGPLPEALRVLSVIVVVGTAISWAVWVLIQVPTYRRADGERRQQLKWLYSGAVILVVTLITSLFILPLIAGDAPGWDSQWAVNALGTIGTTALPVCIGVAVLKYRLYELNRIISRVVSYTVITALLAGVFAGLILLATRVLPVKSSVAVALATLVIAALFNPLRKRVQHAVDRRFNRARYDAEALVAAFSARLQQTVDLDTVRGDLIGVVDLAFQPARIAVWVSGSEQKAVAVATPAPASLR